MKLRLLVPTLLLIVLPIQVAAADLSGADALSLIVTEQKARTFYLKLQTGSTGNAATYVITGVLEGQGIMKGWAKTTIDAKDSSGAGHLVMEFRMKDGKAFVHIDEASGMNAMLPIQSLSQEMGAWYPLSMDAMTASWVAPSIDPSALSEAYAMTHARFSQGHSYAFTVLDGAAVIRSIRSALPTQLQAIVSSYDSVTGMAKVDTNLSSQFQFASFDTTAKGGDAWLHLTSKAQRQFHGAYVETPKKIVAMPAGLAAFLNVEYAAPEAMQSSKAMPSSMSSSSMMSSSAMSEMPVIENHDSSTEMRLPPSTDLVEIRKSIRGADRVILHLLGPDGDNVKMMMRTVVEPSLNLSASNNTLGADGMLYVYQRPLLPTFSTVDAGRGADIAYFDDAGRFLNGASLSKCETPVCPAVVAMSPAVYALQLPEGFIGMHGVTDLWRLALRFDLANTFADHQEMDRASVRARLNLKNVRQPTFNVPQPFVDGGYEHLATLALLTASLIRPADIRDADPANLKGTAKAMKSISDVLTELLRTNPSVQYAYLLKPQKKLDTFQLVLDTYTFAGVDGLDQNHNGFVDASEKPAAPGTLFSYRLYTPALDHLVLDQSSANGIAIYVPVRDEYNNTIAVLAIVESGADMSSHQSPR